MPRPIQILRNPKSKLVTDTVNQVPIINTIMMVTNNRMDATWTPL
jgi:hypothetical protein